MIMNNKYIITLQVQVCVDAKDMIDAEAIGLIDFKEKMVFEKIVRIERV